MLREVDRLVGEQDYFKALMKLQPLIAYEAQLLHMRPHEWRRSSQIEKEQAQAGEPSSVHPDQAGGVQAGMALAAD